MGSERVEVHVEDGVADVVLSRPEKHNALDIAMFEGIAAATERLGQEPGLRVVLLHGEGPSFCSGLDFTSVMADGGGPWSQLERPGSSPPNRFQRAAYDWISLPVPVIAAVHGACFGGGLQIALAADVRFATADARLSVMEIKYGLVPDMSITRTLPRLVGVDVAKELTYTGRVISGAQAADLGLVTHVSEDPLAAARELATEIAARSPEAVRAAKRLLDESWNEASAERALALEEELQLGLIGSPNQLESVSAVLGKRSPEFPHPA
ncbi:MAG: crotonase/enoyl-CoA hydratase family protein [Solirubrobacteraceae bacterium]